MGLGRQIWAERLGEALPCGRPPTLRLDTPGSQEARLTREGVYKGLSSLGRREDKGGGTGLFFAAVERLDMKRGGD